MLRLKCLPARQGDALWVEWGNPPRRMLVDMGTEAVGEEIRRRILALDIDDRVFELLIVTHVDQDHIGGVLTCLVEADPIPGLKIKDLWFNGWDHLHGRTLSQVAVNSPSLEPFGPAQGERLTSWLRGQTWNKAFNGGPAVRPKNLLSAPIELRDGMRLTVIGPTQPLLGKFIATWKEEVAEALRKGRIDEVSPGLELEEYGRVGGPPNLLTATDLAELAETETELDKGPANGSSIAVVLGYNGRRIALTGDAHAPDLLEAFKLLSPNDRLKLDLIKLPHHGSAKNVSIELVKSLACPRWLMSTDGTRFKHPDAVAVARIIQFSHSPKPQLLFNVPSTYNGWWDREEWRQLFNYKTYVGDPNEGLLVEV